jgi:hypothetical protein
MTYISRIKKSTHKFVFLPLGPKSIDFIMSSVCLSVCPSTIPHQLLLHFLTDFDRNWHKARWWWVYTHVIMIFRFVDFWKSYGPWHLAYFTEFPSECNSYYISSHTSMYIVWRVFRARLFFILLMVYQSKSEFNWSDCDQSVKIIIDFLSPLLNRSMSNMTVGQSVRNLTPEKFG